MASAPEDLSRYRWHTGAELRPIAPGEACPPLFRDLGPVALARFLRGTLSRLAGPLTPLTYLRTAAFTEPYVDFEATGRVMLLRPREISPWHSGVRHVFVARATLALDPSAVGFVPGDRDLGRVADVAASMRSATELREELGGSRYDAEVRESLAALDRLNAEHDASEILAAPVRKKLQSRDRGERARAREALDREGLCEADLCAAWHHLPRERRAILLDALGRLS